MSDVFSDVLAWVSERVGKLLGRKAKGKAKPLTAADRLRQEWGENAGTAPTDGIATLIDPAALPLGSRFRPRPAAYSMSMGQMEDISRGLKQIPPLPQGVIQVMKELDSKEASAASVAAAIGREPVMAASILRIANSSAVGLRREVSNVSEAVAYLGFSTTKSLFLRLKMDALVPSKRGSRGYDADKLWVHALAVAQAAEEIARRTGGTDPQLALTAGLLHDIGKLAINNQYDTTVANLWAETADKGRSILDRERELFGADHAFIGAALATEWKLPQNLIDIIRLHHLPVGAPMELSQSTRRALLSVYLANQLVKYRHVYCSDMEIDDVSNDVTKELGLPDFFELAIDTRLRNLIDKAITMNGGEAATVSAAA
jgi:putative nucleotidyltransferase with HDIG domain